MNGAHNLVMSVPASLTWMLMCMTGCAPDHVGREVSPDRFCTIKMELLGKAIKDYRLKHGDVPQVMSGSGGIYSWRVLLAPYMLAHTDHQENIDYRFNEAWDSPHNRKTFRNSWLLGSLTCPLENPLGDYPYVSYVMLVRPKASTPATEHSEKASLSSKAILIVESVQCGIEYTEPKDLDWNTLWKDDSPFGLGKLHSLHSSVVKAIRADGEVIEIPKSISKDNLRKLLNGSE
jgi:hypothetical protein